jgi:hypothetical protein
MARLLGDLLGREPEVVELKVDTCAFRVLELRTDPEANNVHSLSLHFCKRLFRGLPITSWSQGNSFTSGDYYYINSRKHRLRK